MRLLGRLLLLLLAVAALLLGWQQLAGWSPRLPRAGESGAQGWMLAQARMSLAYRLEEGHWYWFPVPSGVTTLRVVTTAGLQPDLPQGTRLPYALDYELRAGEARLEGGSYHFRSHHAQFLDPASGRTFSPAFFREAGVVAGLSKSMLLDLPARQGLRLGVRIAARESAIRELSVRVYARMATPEHRQAHLWLRLNDLDRAWLTRGNVYQPELLKEEEKRNLVAEGWQPIGPEGVEGRDWRAREIYLLRDFEGEEIEPQAPVGVTADPAHLAVVPLPEPGGRVRLRIEQQEGQPPQALELRWYGIGIDARASRTIPWGGAGAALEWEGSFAPGTLALAADARVSVRAFLVEGTGEREITPEARLSRLWLAGGQPLVYVIAHQGGRATPLRLDLRPLPDPADEWQSPPVASWRLLDGEGRALSAGSVVLAPRPSAYDRPAQEPWGELNEPLRLHFDAPPAARRLELSATPAVAVALYNRPPGLIHPQRVPEDQLDFDADGGELPQWFPLTPNDHAQLTLEARTLLAALPPRPPAERPELAAGLYQLAEYRPGGPWLGRQLPEEVPEAAARRMGPLATLFRPLPAGEGGALLLTHPDRLDPLTPALLYLQAGEGPFRYRIELDGRLHHAGEAAGAAGLIELPPLPAGSHRIGVTAEGPVRFFINFAEAGAGALLLRTGYRLSGPLEFTYRKESSCEELLGLRHFPPAGGEGRSRLRVSVTGPAAGPGPHLGWTLRERRYDLRPGAGEPLPLPAAGGARVDPGRPFFLPLGAELPPGEYRIRVEPEAGESGYLTIGRLLPGAYDRQRVYREAEPPMR